MGELKKFEAVKESDKKPEGKNEKIKKNALSVAELEKAAGIKKEKPKEEIRRAVPAKWSPTAEKPQTLKQETISLKPERWTQKAKYERQAIGRYEIDT